MKLGRLNYSVTPSGARQSSGNIAMDCRVALLLAMTMVLLGCSALGPSEGTLSCKSSPNLNGKERDSASVESRKAQAIVGIELAKRVSDQAKSAWFGTGALSGIFGSVSGTEAINLALNVRQLRALVADQKAIDMALQMDGKSPLPSKAAWACQTLADSVASLDTGQSDDQFLRNVAVVEDYLRQIVKSNSSRHLGMEPKNVELK